MECNRDEANRARQIAERKFTARDVAGAKKFALKAQNLFPGLEGLPQMLSTLDVHLSAENKIGGEADWYGVLGVNPLADDETVKKQYRKLALMLHPDKNKSVGADGAFKLISEAWSLLSDKTKRVAYDQKRFLKTSQQKVPPAGGSSSVPPAANGFHNFSNRTSNVRSHKTSSKAGTAPAPAPRHSKPNTFWTACNRCKMQYEYLRVYLNHNLLCPNCHEPFLAVETAPPPSNGTNSSTPWSFSQKRQNSNQHSANKNAHASGRNSSAPSNAGVDSFNQSNFQWGPFSRTTGAGTTNSSACAAAQAASVVQQAYEKVKREREEAQAAAKKQEALRKRQSASKKGASSSSAGFFNTGFNPDPKGERLAKKRKSTDDVGGNAPKQMASGSGGIGMGGALGVQQGVFEKDWPNWSSAANKPNSTRELSQFELRNMLVEKARREICKKLNEWRSAATGMTAEKEQGKGQVTVEKEKDKETAATNSDTGYQKNGVETVNAKKGLQDKACHDTSEVDSNTEAHEPMSITVPDPDFHDFDKDRCERSFGENQVWAAYDDDDGMPRYYAMIHRVISLNPFKMKISWLNSKTNNELGPLNWTGSGFSKTCGDFRIGKYEVNNSLNSFSHRVRWTKGLRGAIRIFPRMGDVWALYRNWSPDWNELTPDEVIHKYDMVEVLDDYNEEQGVSVTPLVKVAGFKTVFHRHLDPREVRMIPREEMFRFSHQVPSYLLTGSEAHCAPKGCRELDPAATPLELLQVITEAKEEVVEIAEDQIMAEARREEIVVIADDLIMTEARREEIVEIADDQITTEAKREDIVEIADDQITTEATREEILNIAEEQIIIVAKGEEIIVEQIITETKREEIVEMAEERLITEARDKEIVDIADEVIISKAKNKDIVKIGENQVMTEAEEEIVKNDEKQVITEADVEIVENGVKQVTTGSNEAPSVDPNVDE